MNEFRELFKSKSNITIIRTLIECIDENPSLIASMTDTEFLNFIYNSNYRVFKNPYEAYCFAYPNNSILLDKYLMEIILDKSTTSKLQNSQCESVAEYIAINTNRVHRVYLGKYKDKYSISF